ncbi:reverse transcriptase domain-containing protein [Tanacetum coccineum]
MGCRVDDGSVAGRKYGEQNRGAAGFADPRVSLILGRSFLRTGRALIDVYGEEITLRVDNEAVIFNLNQTTRYSSSYDDVSINRIDIIDEACKEYVIGVELADCNRVVAVVVLASVWSRDWNLPFELMCDASDFAIGAVLGQRKMKHFQPIHYASKTMTEAQIHYTTTEKEMLSVVYRLITLKTSGLSGGIKSRLETIISRKGGLEKNRAYLALKHVNFDLKTAGDHRKLQLNELNELRDQAYENSLIYKERKKKLHDSKIKTRILNVGDRVLLFNSRLKIFSGKLKTRWSGPFTITKVFPYGTIELSQPDGPNFKVNGHRVKHYFGGDLPPKVSFMRILRLRKVARVTARIALEFAPEFVYVYRLDFVMHFSVSLLLTALCCDDIHDVTPRVSALAGYDILVSEPDYRELAMSPPIRRKYRDLVAFATGCRRIKNCKWCNRKIRIPIGMWLCRVEEKMTLKEVDGKMVEEIETKIIAKDGTVTRVPREFQGYETSEEEPVEQPRRHDLYGFVDHPQLQQGNPMNKFAPHRLP